MTNKFTPNSFQIPNVIVDELLMELTGAELKCYLFVIRKTKGWNKDCDYISVAQFMEVTGLSNKSVISACNSLVDKGLLERFGYERKLNSYRVKSYEITGEKSTSDENQTGEVFSKTGEKSTSDLVKKVHTQNNNKNNKKNNTLTGITKKSASAVDILADFGITGQLADDFITHRKNLKAPITVTAMNGFQREADKARIPLAEALTISIERGWRGFNANWDWREQFGGAAKTSTHSSAKPKFSDENTDWWKGQTIEIYGDNL